MQADLAYAMTFLRVLLLGFEVTFSLPLNDAESEEGEESEEDGESNDEEGDNIDQGEESEEGEEGDALTDALQVLEDDELEDFQDVQLRPHSKDTRPRKTGRVQGAFNQWEPIVQNVSKEVFDAKLAATAQVELSNAKRWSHGMWKPKVGFNSLGVARREHRCPFRGNANSNCCAMLRETVDGDGRYTLERKSGVNHADHSISGKKRGLPLILKVAVASPGKRHLSVAKLVEEVREKHGAVSKKQRGQLVEQRKRLKQKRAAEVVPSDVSHGFGGLSHLVHPLDGTRTRGALERAGVFGMHTGATCTTPATAKCSPLLIDALPAMFFLLSCAAYVCGDSIIDSEKETISIAFSTRNLLLNAWRQQQFGFPGILQVDCTHRLVLEGHLCMLFGTVDAGQHFHIIGYGVCDKEDEMTHTHVFRALKTEMERVVREHIDNQWPI